MFAQVACSIKVAGILAVLICHVCAAMADGVANVTVELYIETLCPYCSKLMNTGIKELLHDGIFDIADVTVVPSVRAHVGSDALLASFALMAVIDFPHSRSPKACPTVLHKGRPAYMLLLLGQNASVQGNAHMAADRSITCQHGEEECYWNRMLACVIYAATDHLTVLQYATCSEATPPLDIAKQAQSCLEELGMSFSDTEACANGQLGAELAAEALERTAALRPAHQYVPWVVVNGQPLYSDYAHLRRYICAAYAGAKPQACFTGGRGREAGLWDALVSITEAAGATVPGHPQQGGQRRGGGTRGLPPRRGSIVTLDS